MLEVYICPGTLASACVSSFTINLWTLQHGKPVRAACTIINDFFSFSFFLVETSCYRRELHRPCIAVYSFLCPWSCLWRLAEGSLRGWIAWTSSCIETKNQCADYPNGTQHKHVDEVNDEVTVFGYYLASTISLDYIPHWISLPFSAPRTSGANKFSEKESRRIGFAITVYNQGKRNADTWWHRLQS